MNESLRHRVLRILPFLIVAIAAFIAGWFAGYRTSREHQQTAHGAISALRLGAHHEIAFAQYYSANVTESQILSQKHLIQEMRASDANGFHFLSLGKARKMDEALTFARIAILEEKLGNAEAAEYYQIVALGLAFNEERATATNWKTMREAIEKLDSNYMKRNPKPAWQLTTIYLDTVGIASPVTWAP